MIHQQFQITDRKLCVPVVTLSLLLQQLKSEFKRTIKWDKYRSQMTVQSNSNNLNYLIDPTFTKINRLFVLHLQEMLEEIIFFFKLICSKC